MMVALAGGLLVLGIGWMTFRSSDPPQEVTQIPTSAVPLESTVTTGPASIAVPPSTPTTVTTLAPTSTTPTGFFAATDGRFSAEFPSPPTRWETTIQLYGRPVTAVSYGSQGTTEFISVSYVEDALDVGADPVLKLAGALGATSARINGRTERQTPTTFLGNPALDAVLSTDQFRVYERVFFAGRRLVIFDCLTTEGSPSASYARMLATFRLT